MLSRFPNLDNPLAMPAPVRWRLGSWFSLFLFALGFGVLPRYRFFSASLCSLFFFFVFHAAPHHQDLLVDPVLRTTLFSRTCFRSHPIKLLDYSFLFSLSIVIFCFTDYIPTLAPIGKALLNRFLVTSWHVYRRLMSLQLPI